MKQYEQIIYLDFDGELTSFNGEILSIDKVKVANSKLSADRIENITSALNEKYASLNVKFVTEKPLTSEYSTVYIGKTDAFSSYGSFAGLAETIDKNNQNKADKAFVVLDATYSDATIMTTISHEVSHLLGTLDHGGEGIDKYACSSFNNTLTGEFNGDNKSFNIRTVYRETSDGVIYPAGFESCNNSKCSKTTSHYNNILSATLTEGNYSVSYDHYISSTVIAAGAMVHLGQNTIINSGKENERVASAYANDLTITNGGILHVGVNGSATNITLTSGGGIAHGWTDKLFTHHGSETAFISDFNQDAEVRGRIDNFNFNGSLYAIGAELNNVTVGKMPNPNSGYYYGYLHLNDNSVASDTTVTGNMYVSSGNSAVNTTIAENGFLSAYEGAIINNLTMTGGSARIDSGTDIKGNINIFGGELNLIGDEFDIVPVIKNSGLVYGNSGAIIKNAVVSSGGTLGGSGAYTASDTIVHSGGYQEVYTNLHAYSTILSAGGSMLVYGSAYNTIIDGGVQNLSGGYYSGYTESTIIKSGSQVLLDYGRCSAVSTFISSGAKQIVNYFTQAWGTVISEGGIQEVIGGQNHMAWTENTTVYGTQTLTKRNAVAKNTEVYGEQYLTWNASAYDTTVMSGGKAFYESYSVVSDLQINAGGHVSCDKSVSFKGKINVEGRLENVNCDTTVYVQSGGHVNNASFSQSLCGIYVYQGGSASEVSITDRAFISAAINKDTYLNVTLHGIQMTASNGLVNKGTVTSNSYLQIDNGAKAENLNIATYGSGNIWGTANSTIVFSSGTLGIASGGIAADTIMNRYAIVKVYSGGTALNTIVNDSASLHVYSGGTAAIAFNPWCTNPNVSAAAGADVTYLERDAGVYIGQNNSFLSKTDSKNSLNIQSGMEVLNYHDGIMENTVVESGGVLLADGLHKGSLYINAGAEVVIYANAVFDFTLSNRSASEDYLINNISAMSALPSFSITVDANQANGTYKLAQGASAVTGAISIGNGTTDYGYITVNGTDFTYGNKTYSLDQANGNLTLTVSGGDVIKDTEAPALSNVLNAAVNNNSVTFTWGAATDNTGVSSYTLTVNGKEYKNISGTNYTLNNLTAGTYNYTLTAYDAAGNYTTSAAKNFTVADTTAPVLTVSGTSIYWTNKSVTLTAQTDIAANIMYSFDNQNWYSGSTVTVDNNAYVYFKATANGQTVTETVEVNNIDKVAPTVNNITGTQDQYGNVVVTADFADNNSVFAKEYKINNGEWQTYTTGVTVDENCIIYFRATDGAGNQSDIISYNVNSFITDTEAPALSNVLNAAVNNNSVTFTWGAATDNTGVSSYTLTVNGKEYKNISGTNYTLNNLTAGTYNYTLTAYDAAGNYTASAAKNFTVADTTAPVLTVSGTSIYWTNKSVTLTAQTDIAANIMYSFDNKNWYSGSTVTVDNNAYVYFKATANGQTVTETVEVNNIDKVAPTVNNINHTQDQYGNVVVTADFSDDNSIFAKEYKINNGEWQTYTTGVTVDENCTIYFRATDGAGNQSGTSVFEVSNFEEPAQKTFIFISSAYTFNNTYGKKQDGIELYFGSNAFDSIAMAEDILGDLSDYFVVVPDKKVLVTHQSDLQSVTEVYAVATPVVEKNNTLTVNAKSQNSLTFHYAAVGDVNFNYFSKVVANYSDVQKIIGGNNTGTVKEQYKSNGDYIFTEKETLKLTGSATVYESDIDMISGYKKVSVGYYSNIGNISGFEVSMTDDSKVYKNLNTAINQNNTVKAVGTLTVGGYSTVGSIDGFKTVTINDSIIGDINRTYYDDSSVQSVKTKLKTDYRHLDAERTVNTTYFDDGKLTVSGNWIYSGENYDYTAKVGDVIDFNKVVIDCAYAGNIIRSTADKYTEKAVFEWNTAAEYPYFDKAESHYSLIEERYAASGSVTLKNGAAAESINGYKNVTLDTAVVAGDVIAGLSYTEKYTAKGYTETLTKKITRNSTFTAETAIVYGDVKNYSTVKLTNSVVGNVYNDNVEKAEKKWVAGQLQTDTYTAPVEKLNGTASLKFSTAVSLHNFKTVTLENSRVNNITNCNKVTIKKGDNYIQNYIGTSGNDTFTVDKGAVLVLEGGMDFGYGNDKLINKGTMVIASNQDIYNANIINRGEIAAAHDIWNLYKNNSILDLGSTSENFRGSKYELADNSYKKAVKWDGEDDLTGWLGYGNAVDVNDTVDYVKFKTDQNGTLSLKIDDWDENSNVLFSVNNTIYEVDENGSVDIQLLGGFTYELRIQQKEYDSMSYTFSIAE